MISADNENYCNPAVFIDQGGTILHDHFEHKLPVTLDSFIPGVFAALQELQKNHLLFIVTNQSAVGLGKLPPDDADKINSDIRQILADSDITIHETFACRHKRTDNCSCIKPHPFFLHKAQQLYNVNLEKSFVIGDHPHDIQFAKNGGAKGLYVLTGHGEKHRGELRTDPPIFPSIIEATDWVCKQAG